MKLDLRKTFRLAQATFTRRVPVYAHFGITHRCDLTCKMCGIWRYGNKKEELSIPEITQMAQRFARLGVVQTSIGGGEPFAYENLEEAAKAFVDAGIETRVLTNAVNVPKERFEKAISYGVRNFSISLDSLYPARFDYICEFDGAWESAVSNMAWLANRLRGEGGTLVMNCVVSNLNLEELPDLVRFAQEIGFAVSFLPVELLSTSKEGVKNWEARFIRHRPEMGLSAGPQGQVGERVDRVYKRLIQLKAEGAPILNSTPYLESSRVYLKTGRFPADGCDAGSLYFSVSPNGQFTICHRTSHAYKHVLDPDFEDYFHSEAYEMQRQLEAGSCEGCMRACWIDTSSMFRTLQGFMEGTTLALRPPTTGPVSVTDALSWARYDAPAPA
ncbi:MAG: radical SAM protein [Myxococcota bacterium]|nr:radical SAM protein [Myxococcota bacterium]